MNKNAIIAVLFPWILGLIGVNLMMLVGLPYRDSLWLIGLTWLLVSPFFIAGMLLVAYREGQWSKD